MQAFDQLQVCPDVMFLPEVGSTPELASAEWAMQELNPRKGEAYVAFVFNPSNSFRGTVLAVRQPLAMHVRDVEPLLTGASLNLRIHGITVALMGIHLPRLKRNDALEVWQDQMIQLQHMHSRYRRHDVCVLAGDWNFNLGAPCDGSDFSILAHSFLGEQGYQTSRPTIHTWENHAGRNSIDFVCVRCPDLQCLRDMVRWDCPQVLASDHALIDYSFSVQFHLVARTRTAFTRCGKWVVDGPSVREKAAQLAEDSDSMPKT